MNEILKAWYTIDLNPEKAEALKTYLKDNNINFEELTESVYFKDFEDCDNQIHIRFLASVEEVGKAGAFLESLLNLK